GTGQPVGRRRTPGEVDPHAERNQASLQARRQVVDDLGLGPLGAALDDGDAWITSAVARVDHHPLVHQGGTSGTKTLGLAEQVRPPADDLTAEPPQGGEGLWAADTVRYQPDLALEPGNRAGRPATQDPVRPSDVVPHLQESLLQCPHVVAEQRLRLHMSEHTGTEGPSGSIDG